MFKKFYRQLLLWLICLCFISACTAVSTTEPAADHTPNATNTAAPTQTAVPTATSAPTATSVATPTSVPVSIYADMDEEARQAALNEALKEDNIETVEELIAFGIDLNQADNPAGLTPILIATLRDNVEMVTLLLEAGADITISDNSASNVLHHAASNNQLEIAKLLLAEEKIDLEARREQWEFTPLLNAAFDGHVEMVELLVEHGADIEGVDAWGDTPLNAASWNGHLEVVQRLVELGANPDVTNVNGDNGVAHGRKQGHEDIEAYLTTIIEDGEG
ncbi:MAG: ankyrin repeat domain-containing protein [Chloroflexota bacterium]